MIFHLCFVLSALFEKKIRQKKLWLLVCTNLQIANRDDFSSLFCYFPKEKPPFREVLNFMPILFDVRCDLFGVAFAAFGVLCGFL